MEFLKKKKKFILVFLGNNLKWKLILLLTFYHHIHQNSGSQVMGWNAAIQSTCQILKKAVNDKVYFLHADKHESLLQVDTAILGERNQACQKYPK